LAKKETIGGEEELLSLLNEIEEYKIMKEKITETVGEVEKQIRNIREAKRREAENTFIADFESTLRKSDRKGIDVMGVLHLSGWQCDRSQIENLTPADEGDGHLTSDKEPAEIAEGYLYYHDNSFCVNYRGIIEHSAFTYETKPPEKNCRAIEKLIKIEKPEQKGKKYNVLTEEKGVMEARMDAKNKEGITEAEKAIFDHAVLDSVEAINAAQALLTKIKEYAKDIKATTASEAKAAIDFLGNLATNERNRLTELEDLHKARIEAIEKDADGEKVPLEGHQLAEINTVYRVRAVHKTLTLLRSFINFSFDEYTSIENLKDLSNLTFNIIDEIKNKLDDECAEIKIGEEYVFAFDLIDKIHQILGENETLNNENAMGKTGVAEAELVYQEALKNPLSGYPYSSIQFTLEDRNKIFHTKTRADIPKAQQEVS
ncbi:5473_t:CDS:2, partial [Funneliformis geosporum]